MKKFVILLFAAIALVVSVNIINTANTISYKDVAADPSARVVILDAGHGGEDGGAVASDGTVEKELNLQITDDIAVFFDLFGITYIPTRTSDVSVCDEGLNTIRKRKYSDIMNRAALMESVPNSILLSIHQNIYSDERYSGTQVFYTANVDDSKVLAQAIQNSVVKKLQPDNKRCIKTAGSEIYLLHKAKNTAVLVECGFLSNKNELALLKDKAYQSKISYRIFRGMFDFLSEEKDV